MPHDQQEGASPFHRGEQQVQECLGVRDKVDSFARRAVRTYMPDQHREFYAELPFVLLGTVDDQGRPWASLVPGRPGFMNSPDAYTLEVAARPLFGDPLHETLKPGADVGLLGIQLETRRRNRMTGIVHSVGPETFAITVRQTFGNCPQYIQTRAVDVLPEINDVARTRPVIRSDRFDRQSRAAIESADTLFIATAFSEHGNAVSQGADVSHRGGRPGFIRVDDDRTFVFPDFSGNNHFNTVGNIVVNPKAGFLFVDFESGDVVHMTGEAEILWEGDEVQAFAGAERLIRFRASEVVRVENSLPLRFGFGEFSPTLDHTGNWVETAQKVAAEKERNVYLPYEICDIRPESDTISSFYLRRADGKAHAKHEPGQFLPIRLTIPGQDGPAMRTYTLSDAPNAEHYRLSIKREGGDALVSTYLHDQMKKGDRIEAMAPRGKFVLDGSSDRPVVLISAGVGLTPMIAMTNHMINEGVRTRKFRRIYFVHGARNGRTLAFGDHLRDLADKHDSLSVHLRLSQPDETDRLDDTHDGEGHVDLETLKTLLPFDDYDFYLCGPQKFMQGLYDGLTALGVRGSRIHYESFGPATVLKHDGKPSQVPPIGEPTDGPVHVSFANSQLDAEWSPDKGTLLDLAEAQGLNPAYSCRSGVCGTCATRIRCGMVDYIEEPVAPLGEHEVLICCATPRSSSGDATCGEDQGVVLEL